MSAILKYHAASGPKKWILWVAVTLTVFIAVVTLYIRLHKREATLKKLRIEAELTTQKSEQLRFDISREKNSAKLTALIRQAQVLQKTAETQRNEIALNTKAFEMEYKQIKAFESWKDLDAYNKKSRS